MKKLNVLLLTSTTINLRSLNQSPRFTGYQFYALDALKYLEKPNTRNPTRGFLFILEKKIQRIKPNYLIVHLGLAFERYPSEILYAVLRAKEHYPKLKVGLDRGLKYAIIRIRDLVDKTSEIVTLIDKLVQNESYFDLDDETSLLAGSLF